jgi:hypothetical protein
LEYPSGYAHLIFYGPTPELGEPGYSFAALLAFLLLSFDTSDDALSREYHFKERV